MVSTSSSGVSSCCSDVPDLSHKYLPRALRQKVKPRGKVPDVGNPILSQLSPVAVVNLLTPKDCSHCRNSFIMKSHPIKSKERSDISCYLLCVWGMTLKPLLGLGCRNWTLLGGWGESPWLVEQGTGSGGVPSSVRKINVSYFCSEWEDEPRHQYLKLHVLRYYKNKTSPEFLHLILDIVMTMVASATVKGINIDFNSFSTLHLKFLSLLGLELLSLHDLDVWCDQISFH